MVRVVIAHGRSQEFAVPAHLEAEWAPALRFGLERVGSPFANDLQTTIAFYGDLWRPDAAAIERGPGDGPGSPLEREVAADLLAHAPGAAAVAVERGGFSSLVALVAALDDRFGVGTVALRWFLRDVAAYFEQPDLRQRATDRIGQAVAAAGAAGDGVVLLGHSMGSVVAYDALRHRPGLPVRGFVTFGSPLGLPTIRRLLRDAAGQTPFPAGVPAWANVFDPDDFVVGDRFLRPHFPDPAGRGVEDIETGGRDPGLTDPIAAHDAAVYLSSLAFAGALDAILRASSEPRAAAPAVGEASFAPPSGGLEANRGDPGPAGGSAAAVDEPPPATDRSIASIERPAPGGRLDELLETARGAREETVDGGVRAVSRGLDALDRSSSEPSGIAPATTSVEAADVVATAAAIPPAAVAAAAPTAAVEADAAAPTGDAAPTRTIERTVSADFPPVVEPGSENLLSYAIAREAVFAGAHAVVPLVAPVAARQVTLTVSVQATGFDILDPETGRTRNFHRVTLDLENEAAEVRGDFLLRAQPTAAERQTTIYVRFSHANLPVGQLALPTTITAARDVAAAPRAATEGGGIRLSLEPAPPPDLVFHISKGEGDRFEIVVDRRSGEQRFDNLPLGDFPVTGKAEEFAAAILEQFRTASGMAPELRASRIDGLGLDLWWRLPELFRDFYWEQMHGQPLSIAINSQEPYIPWELVKPQRSRPAGETAEMFGLAFAIARWKQGRFYPDPLAVSGFATIVPTYAQHPLVHTDAEAADLESRFGARRIPGQYAAVTALLKDTGIQAIHFAGHGRYAPATPNDSRIELADYPLFPTDVNNATIGKSDRPLVFVNACEVGNQGWALTQIGGWADAFCDAGCTAFVGPYWAVNDQVARKAATLFYDDLRSGRTLGEAMQTIRRRFWADEEFPSHPTWLAYSLHCHPNVTVRFADGGGG